MQGARVQSLVWELRSYMLQLLSLCILEPAHTRGAQTLAIKTHYSQNYNNKFCVHCRKKIKSPPHKEPIMLLSRGHYHY